MGSPEPGAERADRSTRIDVVLVILAVAILGPVVFLTFSTAELSRPATGEGERIGYLAMQTNEVRRRFDGDLVWDVIGVGTTLYPNDAVYVADDSAATIALDAGGQIAVDERSLVIMRNTSAQTLPALEIVRGAASGETGDAGLLIEAGGTTVEVSKGSRIRLRVGDDESAEVTVAEGSARLEGKGGAVDLAAGQRQAMDSEGHPTGELETIDLVLTEPGSAARLYAATTTSIAFGWRESGEWLLELAADPGFEEITRSVRTGDNRAEVTGISPGVYFWRVRSIPGAAALRASEERAVIVVRDLPPMPFRPRPNEVVDLSTVTTLDLAWLEIDGVRTYDVELTRAAGTEPLLTQEADRLFLSVPRQRFAAEAEHCFRVRAAGRDSAPWCEPRCFRVVLSPVLPPPVLFEPKDGAAAPSGEQGSLWWWLFGSVAHAQGELPPLYLEWGKIPGATAYLIEISKQQDFATTIVEERVPYPRYRFTPPAPRTFYWRVRAVDQYGRPGRYSEIRTLALDIPAPELVAPAQNHLLPFRTGPPAVRLAWRCSAEVESFALEIASDPAFGTAVDRRTVSGTETIFHPPTLGEYYWRVTALGSRGGRGDPSATRKIVVFAAAPAGLVPAGGTVLAAAGEITPVALSWSPRPVARYEIELARDSEIATPILARREEGTAAELAVEGAGAFYWRVRGLSPTTAWSAVQQVCIEPARPAPLEPAPDSKIEIAGGGSLATVLFTWSPVAGAEAYELSLGSETPAGAIDSIRITEPKVEAPLGPGTFTWRVRALAPGNIPSVFTEERSLTVVNLAPVRDADEGDPGGTDDDEDTKDGEQGTERDEAKPSHGGPVVEARPERDTFHIAPRIAFFTNFGGVISPRFGLGAGYRLPVLDGCWRIVVSGAFFFATARASANGIGVHSQIHGVPIEVGVLFQLPATWLAGFDFVAFIAGLGVNTTIAYTTIAITGQPQQAVTDAMVGGVITVGAEKTLGIGDLFVEVAYTLSSHSTGLVVLDPGGLTLSAGYRFRIL